MSAFFWKGGGGGTPSFCLPIIIMIPNAESRVHEEMPAYGIKEIWKTNNHHRETAKIAQKSQHIHIICVNTVQRKEQKKAEINGNGEMNGN